MERDEQVVQAVARALFDDNAIRYQQALTKPVNSDADVYGRARNALASLTKAQQQDVLRFIQLAMADSASVIFGMLDGSHFPQGIDGDFAVHYQDDEIQGSLQDIWIEQAEQRGIYR
ncbi:hypothetical protein [Kosakonia sp.]|uniref:hypothetical protein n=1 Tax=Kosakonia sp. TaxID=1916651 RepID=UPI0028A11453|nr:hypothetical protein [Kosakonia sp.]